jgi:AcrR family transcriptional regulator
LKILASPDEETGVRKIKRMNKAEKIDRRVSRTRNALREALLSLMEEQDYSMITVEEITARANIGRTTFYLHYRDKEDLLLEELADLMQELTQQIARISISQWQAGKNPQSPILMIFQHVAANEKMYRLILDGEGMLQVIERLCSIFEEAANRLSQTEGELQALLLNSSVSMNFLANYFAGALLATTGWWLKQGASYQAEEIAALFQKMLFPGMKQVLEAGIPGQAGSSAS